MKEAIQEFYAKLPKFHKFLQTQDIDPQDYLRYLLKYTTNARRFVLASKSITEEEIEQIQVQLPSAEKLLPSIYHLPHDHNINHSKLFESGKLYGIDLGSIFAAKALGVVAGEKVLDTCCAPGGKLLYFCDQITQSDSQAWIYGNDISEARLSIAHNLLKKYGFESDVILINADATKISLSDCGGIKFDRVLADVECTHDGSFKHVLKYVKKIEESKKVTTQHQIDNSDVPLVTKKISKKEQKRRLKQKQLSAGKSTIISKQMDSG